MADELQVRDDDLIQQKITEKEAIQNLKTRLLVAKKEADELGKNIYQTQILINQK